MFNETSSDEALVFRSVGQKEKKERKELAITCRVYDVVDPSILYLTLHAIVTDRWRLFPPFISQP